jgi:hypothetical protein
MSDEHSKHSSPSDEKVQRAVVAFRDVDVGAKLTAGKDIHLDSEEDLRLR